MIKRTKTTTDPIKALLADKVEDYARRLKGKSEDLAKRVYYSEAMVQIFKGVQGLKTLDELNEFMINVLAEIFAAGQVILLHHENGAVHLEKSFGIDAARLGECRLDVDDHTGSVIEAQKKVFGVTDGLDPVLESFIARVSGTTGFRPSYFIIFKSEKGLAYIALVGKLVGKAVLNENDLNALNMFVDYILSVHSNLEFLHLLTEEKNKLTAAFENVGDGLIYTDTELNIVLANRKALEMFRAVKNFGRGGNFIEVFKVFQSSERFEEVLIREEDVIFDLTLAGEGFFYSVFSAKVHDENGKITGMVFVARDISDERHTESLKSIFMSTVSHKLRTPLTIIKEGTSLLHEGVLGDLNEKQKKIVASTYGQSQYLSTLVNSLLDFTRIQADIMASVLKKERYSLRSFFADIIDSMTPVFKEKGVQVSVSQEDDGLSMYFDRDKMQTAIGNILDNAAKFNPKGTKVDISVGAGEGKVGIVISDNGVGIPQKHVKHLFESFSQLDEDFTGQIKGMGLGLYIAREIIKAHGGEIVCESETGKGTKFTITLAVI